MNRETRDCRRLMLILLAVPPMFLSSKCSSHALGTPTENASAATPATTNVSSQNSSARITTQRMDLVGGSMIIAAVEDTVLVIVIYLTKTVDRSTSILLISQCAVDFMIEIWGGLLTLRVICTLNRISFCFICILRLLSLHLLTLSTLNIYIAVCKSTCYRKCYPWTTILLAAVLLLGLETALQLLLMYADTSFYVNVGAYALSPTYTSGNWWVGFIVLLIYVFVPMTVTILCQYKIHQVGNVGSVNIKRHLRLSYLIAFSTTVTICTFIIPHALRAFRIYNIYLTLSILIHMIFNILKLPYYLVVYKPFRVTVKNTVCCAEFWSRRTPVVRPASGP